MGRAGSGDDDRRGVVSRSARAHAGIGLHGHVGRVRRPRRSDDPQGHQRRPARHRTPRLGVVGVLPRQPVRGRGRRLPSRPEGPGAALRRGPRPLRDRAGRRRDRAHHGGPRHGPGRAGHRRRRDRRGGVRRHRARLSRGTAAAHVRGVVDRVGAPGPHRSGHQRRSGICVRLALGVHRPVASRGPRGSDDDARAARTRATERRRTDRPPPERAGARDRRGPRARGRIVAHTDRRRAPRDRGRHSGCARVHPAGARRGRCVSPAVCPPPSHCADS